MASIGAARGAAKRDREVRDWGNLLSLWRLCGNAACRRARCCRGNGRACFGANYPLLPEGVRGWFEGLGAAQKDGVSFDDAMAWLDREPAGAAFRDWCERVELSLLPPPERGRVGEGVSAPSQS